MEKIIIKEISDELRTKAKNVPFWGVKLADGREATIWDVSIAEAVKANLNVESEAEIRGQGSFLNIRAFNGGDKGTMPVAVEAKDEVKPMSSNDERGKSIVAQCLTKVVYGQDGGEEAKVLETYRYFLKNL